MPWACLMMLTLIPPHEGMGSEAAAADYRQRFAAYAIQPRDIVIRLPNQRIYIGPHVQEFLAGLHAEWEDRPTRWTLGVRNALEAGDVLPPFPTAVTDTPGGAGPALENEPLVRGRSIREARLEVP